MPNVDEIKNELDNYYKSLTGKIKANDAMKVARKINELFMCQNDMALVVKELFRFRKEVSVKFFGDLDISKCETERITDLFMNLSQALDMDSKQVPKIRTVLIDLHSKQCNITGIGMLTAVFLRKLWFDGKLSANEKINQLSSFLHKTNGHVYVVEYLDCKRTDVEVIRDITLQVYGEELTRSEYYRSIKVWFEEYGFEIPNSDNEKGNNTQPTSNPQMERTSAEPINKPVLPAAKAPEPQKELCSSDSDDKSVSVDITAFTQAVKSISDEECGVLLKAISGLRDNITEANRLHRENAELKVKVSELEAKLAAASVELTKTSENLTAAKSELDDLREKSAQQAQQIEYLSVMNKREDEQAVLTLKNNLVGALRLYYEDWQEYSNSECTENNYQSLLIILKKIFKTLDRNGILFEE